MRILGLNAVVWVLLFGMHLAKTAAGLPSAPHKLLVVIASYNPLENKLHLQTQFSNLHQACEQLSMSVEVHVLCAASHCNATQRTSISMRPCHHGITVRWQIESDTVGIMLPKEQRAIFARNVGSFDYFLYMEDDLDLRWQHIQQYLVHWQQLADTPYMPLLRKYEEDTDGDHPDTQLDTALGRMILAPQEPSGRLFWHSGSLYFEQVDFYAAHHFVPGWLLQQALDAKQYGTTVPQDHKEWPREYFACLWLRETGLRPVWPVTTIMASLVHHMSNKYHALTPGVVNNINPMGLLPWLSALNLTISDRGHVDALRTDRDTQHCLEHGGLVYLPRNTFFGRMNDTVRWLCNQEGSTDVKHVRHA